MHGAHELIEAMAVVLCVAAVTTVVFQRLRQPVVLGYLLAGLIVGPYVPIPLVASADVVRTLSELGVILLMFALGLEFSFRKLLRVGAAAAITAILECTLMVWLGFVVARLLGWTRIESLFTGALVAIASTTIIVKAFDDHGIRGRLREFVIGVLVVEDLIAILLMAGLTAISTGAGLSASGLVTTVGRLAGFLVALVVIGLLIVPRAIRYVTRLRRNETTIVASVGLCFGVALLAANFGYAVALGAFVAGALVAESGQQVQIERLVQPLRDVFAAVFFVSVGMSFDPRILGESWAPVLAITGVVLLGKFVGVAVGAFLTGAGTRTSVQAGMSLTQIGEFSFIIAGLGLTLGSTRPFLYPVAVAVSGLTALTTPLMIRASGPTAAWIDRKLPRPLQTFATLYATWIEGLRKPANEPPPRAKGLPALLRLLLLDTALLIAVLIGAGRAGPELVARLRAWTGGSEILATIAVLAGACAAAAPFAVGIVRLGRSLGLTLAERVLPMPTGRLDLAAAPRRALVVTLQLATVLLTGLPIVAITQPFVPASLTALALALGLVVLAWSFWRSATNLQGHVRAGAEVIAAAIAKQSHSGEAHGADELERVQKVLPGLGNPILVELSAGSAAVGKTLGSLNVRGSTGATVLAIRRGEEEILLPSASDVLRPGDILALAGTKEAEEAARRLLASPARASPPEPHAPAA